MYRIKLYIRIYLRNPLPAQIRRIRHQSARVVFLDGRPTVAVRNRDMRVYTSNAATDSD